jgi:pyruvate,orthophosphate dikinase
MTWSVVSFGAGAPGSGLIGASSPGLGRLAALGLPTPPGFVLAIDGWPTQRVDEDLEQMIWSAVVERISQLEQATDRRLSDRERPLLLSVRSSARAPVPGRNHTILNLGLDAPAHAAIAEQHGERFAAELELRFLQSFGAVVHGMDGGDGGRLEAQLEAARDRFGGPDGLAMPGTALAQLRTALNRLWSIDDDEVTRRFVRRAAIAPATTGLEVVVQAMVFGNLPGGRSGSGVVYSRNPLSGSPEPHGGFAIGHQGTGSGSGRPAEQPIAALRTTFPDVAEDLEGALALVETELRDMCEVDFTVEQARLSVLRVRPGRRSRPAAVRIAVDLVDEGILDVDAALDRIPTSALARLQAPVLAAGQALDVLGRGAPAAPGVAVGRLAVDVASALDLVDRGEPVVLVRPETTPADLEAMLECSAVVTAIGGVDSHAAVVARGIGRPAVCGVADLQIDERGRGVRFGATTVAEGESVVVDGTTGTVIAGGARLVPAMPDLRTARVLDWLAERRGRVALVADVESATVVRSADDLVDLAPDSSEPLVLEEDVDAPDPAARLEELVASIRRSALGAPLYLRLPDLQTVGDVRPPIAPWSGVVADPESWAAQLVAARIRFREPRR